MTGGLGRLRLFMTWRWVLQCPRDELGGCRGGQGLPLPFRKDRRQEFPTVLSEPNSQRELIAEVTKPKTRAAFRWLLGGRRSSFIPPLQLQHCNYMLWWKTQPPLLLSREIQSPELLCTRKSALLCLPWKTSSLKTSSSPPSQQSLRNENWRTFPSHSSFIFTHFQSHFTFLLVTQLWTRVAGPLPGVSLTCQVTHPKSTEQIKVYL